MIELYVLDVPEFREVIDEVKQYADEVDPVGDYVRFRNVKTLVVDRRKAGVRQSIWYSSIGALRGGKVVQFDRDALVIEPD
ncbi:MULTISPECIES: glyoxalase [unclassified Mycobacterium]|uniref:glyoxalase n=1 Tax=unclassified Mycobacterium TaxID=2642494 RepID=UPI0029C9457E|nr:MULTISPECIES: glyoxalase [unclassified Mycobacterium]